MMAPSRVKPRIRDAHWRFYGGYHCRYAASARSGYLATTVIYIWTRTLLSSRRSTRCSRSNVSRSGAYLVVIIIIIGPEALYQHDGQSRDAGEAL